MKGQGKKDLGLTYLDRGELLEVAKSYKLTKEQVSRIANGRCRNARVMAELRRRNDANAKVYQPQQL